MGKLKKVSRETHIQLLARRHLAFNNSVNYFYEKNTIYWKDISRQRSKRCGSVAPPSASFSWIKSFHL